LISNPDDSRAMSPIFAEDDKTLLADSDGGRIRRISLANASLGGSEHPERGGCTREDDQLAYFVIEKGIERSDIDQEDPPSDRNDKPYSVFSKAQKRWIVFIIAFAGMFSPLSNFIYNPATHALAEDLHTSIEATNLSITTYMIASSITPSILGDAADQIGRRPIYIFAFVVYFAANIGLALQDSYPALLVLRIAQSVGSSGAMALPDTFAQMPLLRSSHRDDCHRLWSGC
jgi:hypothetical protein